MIRPGLNVMQMLFDPEEGRFLQALLASADDRRTLLDYADHLHGQDEPRDEFLRLEHLLAGTGHLDGVGPEQQARYQELLGLLAPFGMWLRVVRRTDRILNCAQASAQPLAVRFRYQCPNQWETLAPTQDAGVRYCGDCRRNVYYCDSVESVERRAVTGDCIAVPQRLTTSVTEELTRCVTGMPDVHKLWGEKLFGG